MNKIKKLLISDLDNEIIRIEKRLNEMPLEEIVKRRYLQQELERLVNIKNKKQEHKIKAGDILKISGTILTVALVLKHEETNVITSKIWNSVAKLF